MYINIMNILEQLSIKRPLFHNEKDFQFEFALLLNQLGYKTRLETYIGKENGKRKYIDLVAIDEEKQECYLFEFKYKTLDKQVIIDNEIYDLFNHAARDLGSYAFLKDVQRIENLINKTIFSYKVKEGYAILLTNDLGYLKGFKQNSLCYNYGLEDGKLFESNNAIKFLVPNDKEKKDTSISHLDEIIFINEYKIVWEDYSKYLKLLLIRI
ncbi:MAG: hypothetical protein IJV94_04605 [Bacilli bacterium]|nr:hypothetical protein [Bacilli bacterium]